MRLTVFNGSPRGKAGNSALMLQRFLDGFAAAGGEVECVHLLARRSARAEQLAAWHAAEAVLVAFPLYVDAMPALVKELLEDLDAEGCGLRHPPLLFLVQSGFPEACHARPLERWLEKLARRLGAPHLGTMVRGGGEGIRDQPAWMTRKLFDTLSALGRSLAETGRLDPALLTALAGKERFAGVLDQLGLRLASRVSRAWWNAQLRRHGALARRDAAPHGPAAPSP
jgi:NAD(P)H-dependent FMN reductase